MTFTRRKFFTFSGSVAALSLFSQAEAMPVEPPTKYDGDFDIVIREFPAVSYSRRQEAR